MTDKPQQVQAQQIINGLLNKVAQQAQQITMLEIQLAALLDEQEGDEVVDDTV